MTLSTTRHLFSVSPWRKHTYFTTQHISNIQALMSAVCLQDTSEQRNFQVSLHMITLLLAFNTDAPLTQSYTFHLKLKLYLMLNQTEILF